MKYVVFGDFESAAIFPEWTEHKEVSISEDKPTSAGFVKLTDKAYCYGNSVSLGLESRPEDSRFLTSLFFKEVK